MLLMVLDSNVAKIASADSLDSLPADIQAENETSPQTLPPATPPDEPQRPVEPGTITQGWGDSNPVSLASDQRPPSLIDSETQLVYETSYGNFFLLKDSPYFVGVSDRADTTGENRVADSAFLVMFQGKVLQPSGGIIDAASSNVLTFHYNLLAGKKSAGVLTVTYTFYDDRNKISLSFDNSVGAPEDFQIIWLTFTKFSVADVTTMPSDVEQRFEDLQGYGGALTLGSNMLSSVGMPSTKVKPTKGSSQDRESSGLYLNVDDAAEAGDWAATYAGHLTLGDRAGNAVVSVFLAGHLTIDPQLLYSGEPQDATSFSGVQRKTFYDGERYWAFWKDNPSAIDYKSSVDGKDWGYVQRAITTQGTLTYNFDVANDGDTVAIVFVDSAFPDKLRISTGKIFSELIQWDNAWGFSVPGGRELYATQTIVSPPSMTFANYGRQFAVTWRDTANGWPIEFERWTCKGPGASGSSACATTSNSGADQAYNGQYSLVVPFDGDSGAIARIKIDSYTDIWPGGPHSKFYVKVYYPFDDADGFHAACGDVQFADTGQDLGVDWINLGLFTATPVGNYVSIFFRSSGSAIANWLIDIHCAGSAETSLSTSSAATYLAAGRELNGDAMYLFYVEGGAYRYARIAPHNPNILYVTPRTLAAYTNPYYVTAAQISSRFIPMMFTRAWQSGFDGCTASWCLYYVNFPLPLDGEAAVNNPWATKLGAPFVNGVGGVVNPSTGLLAAGQVLVGGTPSVSIIHQEPGRFYRSGSIDASLDGASTPSADFFQIAPGISYDFPWICGVATVCMQGGQKLSLTETGMSGNIKWYNNTNGGLRTTLRYDGTQYNLTLPSGAYMLFASSGILTKASLDASGANYVLYSFTSQWPYPISGTITDSSGRAITFSTSGYLTTITYGNQQTTTLASTGLIPPGCTGGSSADSGTYEVTDAIGRKTTYYICVWKLVKLTSPNGGRVNYTYADYSLGQQVWQGTEVYSLPLLKMDIYNESGTNVKSRSLVFNWNFQNGEVVRAVVNTTDKSAVVQGSNEYIFNPAMGTASVRVYDSAGQFLYYDMETCTPSPCGGSNQMKDLSGNANHGYISGTTSVYGAYGKARNNTDGGYVWAADTSSLKPPNAVSISVWIKPGAITDTYHPIVSKYQSWSPVGGYLLTLDKNIGGKVRFFVYPDSSGTVSVASDAVPAIGVWIHIVAVAEAGGKMRMYINGVQQADVKDLSGIYHSDVQSLYVGQWAGTWKFKGDIDEVRLFGRALSSEDAGALYKTNALKRGEQQSWYSINDQPHLVEGFVGDESTASVVTQDAIDDWGNQIYHRDASGNESFASYANTDHQNQFYAPGRLTKNSGTQFNTEFVDFSEGVFPTGQGAWTVTSLNTVPAQLDYARFAKVTPSLRVNADASQNTTVQHRILTPGGPRFVEFRLRVSSTQQMDIFMGTSPNPGAPNFGLRLLSGQVYAWTNGNPSGAFACSYTATGAPATYAVYGWYRFTFEVDMNNAGHPYKAYMNGMDLSCTYSLLVGNYSPDTLTIYLATPGTPESRVLWIDDIKIYNNNNGALTGYDALKIGFAGLQLRQSIELLDDAGQVIDQGMQAGTNTMFLSFNSVVPSLFAYQYAENGHNARTTVRIYAEDGTLEYQSPLTRFFVGEQYTYTRPRAFADELLKTRSGSLYWPQYIYADEPDFCGGNTSCSPGWTWQYGDGPGAPVRGAQRGNWVHTMPFDYGYRGHLFTMPEIVLGSNQNYFVTYVRIPAGKAPDEIEIGFQVWDPSFTPSGGHVWVGAQWGNIVPCRSYGCINAGPIPSARDQWIELAVKVTDLTTTSGHGVIPGDPTWGLFSGVLFGAYGGEAQWDLMTTLSATSLTVTGLNAIASSGLTVGVYDSSSGALVASGIQSGDSATVDMYRPSSTYNWNSFPVQANVKIYDASNEYYYGPARDVWPGDSFRFVGRSSFFDSKSPSISSWPQSTVHTAIVGSKSFSGDCLDAVLCYDMESFVEGATAVDTGAIAVSMLDLSGRGNGGVTTNPTLAPISSSAAGLGVGFGRPAFQAMSAIAASTGADVMVTLPAHQMNDVFLLLGLVRDQNDAVTVSGWTAIAGTPFNRGTTSRYWLFWYRATSSSTPNPVFDKSTTTGDTYVAVVSYRGATPFGDPWTVKGPAATGTSDPAALTGITTLDANSLIVAGVGGEDNNNAAITTTGTNPFSYATHYVESATGADGVVTFSEASRSPAGATGTVSVNWDVANPVGWGGMVLALASAPATSSMVTTNTVLSGVTASVTISAWVYLSSTSLKGAFVKIGSGSLNGYGLGVGSGSWDTAGNNLIGLYEGVRWIDTGAGIGTGLHYVAMVISASGVPSFYRDGNLVSGSFSGTNPVAPTSPTAVGGYNPDGAHPRHFSGSVDQILVYNKALTSTEILGRFHSRMPGSPQVYLQPSTSGLIQRSRVPYEGTYLYAAAAYDAKGNLLSVTDVGRARGINVDAITDNTASIGNGGGTMSWVHTPAGTLGTPSLVTVGCIAHDGNTFTVSATYGGTPTTSAISSNGVSSMTTFIQYLNGPASGAQTVAVTLGSGWTVGRIACSATTWTGTNGVDTSIANSAYASGAYSQALSVGGSGKVPPNEIFFSVLGRFGPSTGPQADTVSGTGASAALIDNDVDLGTGSGFGCIDAGNSWSDCVASAQLLSAGTQITWSWSPYVYDEAVGIGIKGLGNVTTNVYSALDGRDYLTQTIRPDGKEIYFAYDFLTGVKYGTLDVDCRRSRTQYDVMGRPTQISVYDADASEVVHLDMETFTSNGFKDVSCAGETDSTKGQPTSFQGTAAAAGIDGMARAFTASSHWIDAGDAASTRPQYTTVSAWVKTTSTANQWAVSKWKSGSAANSHYLLVAHYTGVTPNRPVFFVSNGATSDWIATVSRTVNDGKWHLLAGTYDGTTVSIYVDGVLDNSKTSSIGGLQITAKGTPLVVGQESSKTGVAPMVGSIDDVRVFNKALSATEVASLFRFRYKQLTSSYQAYDDMAVDSAWAGYQFPSVTAYDGVSIPRKLFLDMETVKLQIGDFVYPVGGQIYLEDLSGNGNHVQLYGYAFSDTGSIGRGRAFWGTGVFAEVKHSASISLSAPLTIAFSARWDIFPAGDGTCGPGSSSAIPLTKGAYTGSWWFELRSNGQLDFYLTFPGPVYVGFPGLGVQSLNHIYRYAATYDGQNVRLYRDGSLVSTTSETRQLQTTTSPLSIAKEFGTGCGSKHANAMYDEIHLLDSALTDAEIAALYAGTEKSHLIRAYQDGLGRTVRNVAMDMFGKKITTVTSVGWNDKPLYSYLPSGGYFAYSYDFLGRTLSARTPGDSTISGLSRIVVSEKAKIIESIDPVGRKAYTKTDLLGRTTETAVWNVSSLAYGNFTATAYNALSKVVSSTDARGQTTTVYYNSLGLPKLTIFPDGTNASVYYDDNLRPFQTVDVMGRVSVSSYDNLGRLTSTVLKPSLTSPPVTVIDRYLNPISGTSTYYNTWDSVTGAGTGDCSTSQHFGCVNDGAAPDDATTYVSTATTSEKESHLMEDLSIPAGYTDIDVTWEARCQKTQSQSGGQISHLVRETDGTAEEDVGPNNEFTCPNGSWSTFTFFMEQSPGGGEWTPAEINALECGYQSSTDVSPAPRVTNVRCRVQVTYPGYTTRYSYDPVHDDLKTIDNGTANISWGYDSLHRMVAEKLEVPAGTSVGTVGYGYDAAGKVLNITYPMGAAPYPEAVYTYDSLGRASQVDYGGSKYAVLTYDAFGRLDTIRYWKGTTDTLLQEKHTYDARDRLSQLIVSHGATGDMSLSYLYNKASEIVFSADDMWVRNDGVNGVPNYKSVNFSYDGNGRLAQAVGPYGPSQTPQTLSWTYDSVGNLQTSAVNASTYAYRYGASPAWNRLDTFSFNSMSFQWNAAGSMICKTESGGYTKYAHDFRQELTTVQAGATSCTGTGGTTYTYGYDGLGRRVKTSNGTTTSYFMSAGTKMLYSKVGAVETAYVYVGDRLVLRKDSTSTEPRYYIHDATPGSVRLIAYYTTSVQTEAKYRYKPLGDLIVLFPTGGSPQRFQFAQQELDSGVRLYHMGARFYDPIVGRFIERDPIGPGYSYAGNNPISFWDPTGMRPWWGGLRNWLASPTGRTTLRRRRRVGVPGAAACGRTRGREGGPFWGGERSVSDSEGPGGRTRGNPVISDFLRREPGSERRAVGRPGEADDSPRGRGRRFKRPGLGSQGNYLGPSCDRRQRVREVLHAKGADGAQQRGNK